MSVVVLGLSYKSAPLGLLERTTVDDGDLPKALDGLSDNDDLSEVVLLSTCLRTEVYAVADQFHDGVGGLRRTLAELSGVPLDELSEHLYCHFGDTAISHLFGVAAGLESAVLGEGEVLGQVRRAWERAESERAAGPVLRALFRHAVEVGKRARSETAIARGITSLSHAAVALAGQRLSPLSGRRALVLGAGEMGGQMAAALVAAGAEVRLLSRTWSRAKAVATRTGATPVPLGALPEALAWADVALTSTGANQVVLGEAELAPAMAARADRSLLVVDVAVPRDVDPDVAELPGITLLDMDDLRAFAEAGLAGRQGEVGRVRAIVTEEVARYQLTSAARAMAPLVTSLRDRAEGIRRAELERQRSRLAELDPAQQEAVDAVTRAVVAKLLHEPTVRLKRDAGSARGERLSEAARALFDL
ncbi:MAG: glutamyl-tRNA reductase [Acidimicrobiales bacterium]|nr:glutamyl-tRNA reductase [Acidimicrobiales bacterium]